MEKLNIVVFGLSITSSWSNGHATIYRSLLKALARRGHNITFFERDLPWYAEHRDLPNPSFCRTVLYHSCDELDQHETTLAQADLIILSSYVTEAGKLTDRITLLAPPCFAFYDMDTPVTLAGLSKGNCEYLNPQMIPQFDVYLSSTGGPILRKLENEYQAQRALPLYCSVDPELYYPAINNAFALDDHFALGYLGTYSDDRQSTVHELLIEPARRAPEQRFCVAGAQYPKDVPWPTNIERIEHLPPQRHRAFYNAQRFTLNVTRRDMIQAGYSPSVRLFEAAACSVPIISDYWTGLESFFDIGAEILVAQNADEMLKHLAMGEDQRLAMGRRLREKVLARHTAMHRALELENYWCEVIQGAWPNTGRYAHFSSTHHPAQGSEYGAFATCRAD